MKSNFFILTAPVRSGKTTVLSRWIQQQPNKVNGILTPDIEGVRVMQNLQTGETFPFELAQKSCPEDIEVGRFLFAKAAFDKASQILNECCTNGLAPIIIDEVGKLELINQGFEPTLSKLIAFHRNSATSVLLVVRESLLKEVRDKYELQKAEILPFTEQPKWNLS